MVAWRLILCTDGRFRREPERWRRRVTRALGASGPAVLLWLREPDLHDRLLLALAREMAEACRDRNVGLVLRGRVDIALLAGPHVGVHLPADGLPTAVARRLLGKLRPLGRSCHGAAECAAEAHADYVTLSPIWPTASKPGARSVGAEALADAGRGAVFALGGVRPSRVREALGSGASGVAVRSAVFDAADPAEAVAELLAVLDAVEAHDRVVRQRSEDLSSA